MSYADWMSKLPEAVRERPLSQIAIPGTHDSATSGICMSSPIGPNLKTPFKDLIKATCQVGKTFIVKWSITQSLDLTAQMNGGIRYFDLRLSFDINLKDFFITHGLVATSLLEILLEVQSFIKAHPGEVVLLDFNHFYAMNSEQHVVATDMIMHYLSDFLHPMPSNKAEIPSIKECVDSNLRVLLFYHATFPNMKLPFWPGDMIPSPWPNTHKVKPLIEFLEERYNKGRNSSTFYVTQGILTPDPGLIIKYLFRSLHSVADSADPAFINWLKNKKTGPQGINICIIDFFQDFEYVPTVLALNK